jgi:hypothetical protein
MREVNSDTFLSRGLNPVWAAFVVSIDRLILVGVGFVFSILIMVTYVTIVAPVYGYHGLVTQDIASWYYGAIVGLSVLPLLWMPIQQKTPSGYAMWMLYIFVIAPFPYVSSQLSKSSIDETLLVSVLLIACFGLMELFRRFTPIVYRPVNTRWVMPDWILTRVFPTVVVFGALYLWSLVGFEISLGIFDVYERRLVARQLLPAGSLLAYVLAFVSNAGITLLLSLGYHFRRREFVVTGFITIVATFSFNGSKSYISQPILALLIVWLSQNTDRKAGTIMLASACVLLLAAMFEQLYFDSITLNSLLVSRMIYVPSQLGVYYWEFFSVNPLVMMRDGLLRAFGNSPYHLAMPNLIGLVYLGNYDNNANVSMFFTSFGDFGIAGMLGISVIGGIILKWFDAITSEYSFPIAAACCALTGFYWSQAGLPTSLLSNAVLCYVVLLWLPNLSDNRDRLNQVVAAQ